MQAGTSCLGVRSSTLEADQVLRQALAGRLVADDRPPSYSLLVAPDQEGGRRRLHLLYRHGQVVARGRHLGELVLRLLAHLASHVELAQLIPLRMAALVTDGRAILVPEGLRGPLAERQSRLRADGVRLVDSPLALLDATTGAVVVADPGSFGNLEAIDGLPPPRATDDLLPPAGRHPVAAWGFPTGQDHRPLTPLEAVALAMLAVQEREVVGTERALRALARTAEGAVAFPVVAGQDPMTVVATGRDLAGRG